MRASPIDPNRTDGRGNPDRHHHQAFDKGRTVGVRRDSRVGIDVLNDYGLAVEHSPTADTGAHGETLAFPERRYRILIGVVAQIALSQHKSRTIGTSQLASGATNRSHDAFEIACQ